MSIKDTLKSAITSFFQIIASEVVTHAITKVEEEFFPDKDKEKEDPEKDPKKDPEKDPQKDKAETQP